MPSKVYDAMSSGAAIIVISDENNDVSYMVKKDEVGISVPVKNIAQLKSAVIKLADDSELLEKYQKNARRIAVEQYSVENITNQYAKLFGELT